VQRATLQQGNDTDDDEDDSNNDNLCIVFKRTRGRMLSAGRRCTVRCVCLFRRRSSQSAARGAKRRTTIRSAVSCFSRSRSRVC